MYYPPKQKQYPDKYLIRKDGLTFPYNPLLAEHPDFFVVKGNLNAPIDLDWASKGECLEFAKKHGVDLPPNKSLAWLREKVRELCQSSSLQ